MAELIHVVCGNCKTAYRLKETLKPGSKLRCRKCGSDMTVPTPKLLSRAPNAPAIAGSEDDRQVSLAPMQEAPTLTAPGDILAGGVFQAGPAPAQSESAAEARHATPPAEEGTAEAALRSGDPGSRRYICQGSIRTGGMGEILLCVDRDARRQIAMKRILPEAAADPARRARFVEEAQVTAQLEHPNIVPVHELGRDADGNIYFTMKLVRGRSLAEILREMKQADAGGPPLGEGGFPRSPSPGTSDLPLPSGEGRSVAPSPSLSELLQTFLKVCDGVAFAHSRGVVHRDLKPANIMVGDFGEVLVTDWGLAKIVGREDVHAGELVTSSRADSGEAATMAGATVGTPAYMSPEQAAGKLDQIDQRSDIYSLGAILYEILTLERPVAGETPMVVVANVLHGKIVAAERRTPNRHVPGELSAVAMKCLSKAPERRYQSVAELRSDISLFLEGRSVSARPDTLLRGLDKLVKRNKGVSVTVAAAATVLLAMGAVFTYDSAKKRRLAEAARDVALKERAAAQEARDQQHAAALAASERFAKQAVRAAEYYRWDEAEQRAGDADAVCPDGPWALYARGRLAQIKKEHEKAADLFRKALKIAPKNEVLTAALNTSLAFLHDLEAARKLLEKPPDPNDWRGLERFAEAMMAEGRWREAQTALTGALRALDRTSNVPPDRKTELTGRLRLRAVEARAWVACEGFSDAIRNLPAEEQLKRAQEKLSAIHGKRLKLRSFIGEGGRKLCVSTANQPIETLVPFKGVALTELHCSRIKASDLTPLKGMRLERLQMAESPVSDLGPLQGMPLTLLNCWMTPVSDLGPLKGMPLAYLNCSETGVSDLGPLKGMPLASLLCSQTAVSDLSPLKGMPLTFLDCSRSSVGDLGPLQGMPLTYLNCYGTRVSSLSSLKGMPLTSLCCMNTRVSDLTPLKGMPLTSLICVNTRVRDLTPLQGMALATLQCCRTHVTDLSPLQGMPLKYLSFENTGVSNLGPLKGMPLVELRLPDTRVSDLAPLKGMKLKWLSLTPRNITKGIEVVRGMKSLEEIGAGRSPRIKPEQFWRKYDAGEFK